MMWLTQNSLAHSWSSVPFLEIALILIASASLFLSAPIRTRRYAHFDYFVEYFDHVYDMDSYNNILMFVF